MNIFYLLIFSLWIWSFIHDVFILKLLLKKIHNLLTYSYPITLWLKCYQLITRPLTPTETCTAASHVQTEMLQMLSFHLVIIVSLQKPLCEPTDVEGEHLPTVTVCTRTQDVVITCMRRHDASIQLNLKQKTSVCMTTKHFIPVFIVEQVCRIIFIYYSIIKKVIYHFNFNFKFWCTIL